MVFENMPTICASAPELQTILSNAHAADMTHNRFFAWHNIFRTPTAEQRASTPDSDLVSVRVACTDDRVDRPGIYTMGGGAVKGIALVSDAQASLRDLIEGVVMWPNPQFGNVWPLSPMNATLLSSSIGPVILKVPKASDLINAVQGLSD